MSTIRYVRKRDGRLEEFNRKKIERAVSRALIEVGLKNGKRAAALVNEVLAALLKKYIPPSIPGVEDIQDQVEDALIKNKLSKAAKAYILYRERRAEIRQYKDFFGVRDDLKLGVNAIKVLERRYLLKNTRGEVTETPSQLFRRVAKTVAAVEEKYGADNRAIEEREDRFYKMMAALEFIPNTPTLMNAGAPLGQLSACFVVPLGDSITEIFDALKATAEIHKSGGGTGFDFSPIRPKGDFVYSTGGTASGPLSFMKIFDTVTDVIKQGGKRRGANMGIIRVEHPDILEFITAKADPKNFSNFNISVAATDAFMKAVARNSDYNLINPHAQKKIGRLNARQVFNLITTYSWKTGDPGMIFIDEINRKNPTRHIGKIASTNPCGEQPLHPWESCNLGSVNLSKFVEGELLKGKINWKRLREAVLDGVRFLDNVIDANKYPLQEIAEITHANRRMGLGVMGFAEALILMGLPYYSLEAVRFAKKLMKFINNEAHAASKKLGKERGSFPNFRGSLWQKKMYSAMRNATVTTIAPTGTISIIAGCSSGIEPLFAVSFVRNVMDGTKLIESNKIFEDVAKKYGFFSTELLLKIAKTGSVQKMSEVPEKIKRLFQTALEIHPVWHVRMQAAFQKYTDNAVSKTINLPESSSPEEVREAYLLAYKLKCKGITIYRYGSKPEQVLSIGPMEPGAPEKHVTVDSEFAGGCPAGVCAYATT